MSDPTQPVGAVETTQNQAAPVAPAATPAPAAPVAEAAAPAKEKKERVPRASLPKQNGVSRPGGGVTGQVWDVADSISQSLGQPAPRKQVIEECKKRGINDATIATQYGRWRKYHGLGKEKVAAPAATAAPAPAADTTVEAPKA